MNTITKLGCLLVFILAIGLVGCKKDPVMFSKGLESLTLIEKDAAGLVIKEYPGIIAGEEIVVAVPIEVDVTKLVVDFKAENARTIVQIGSVVQEAGITAQDFSEPVALKIKAEDKSTRTYLVKVEKKIALLSFGFYMADNPGLEEDYKAIIRGTKIDIQVPESINLTNLVARFTTTAGGSLKIGAVSQQSQVTMNNFKNPITYLFEAQGLPGQLQFVATVSFTGKKWWMIGDKNIIIPTASELRMAIDPITKYPYLAYIRSGLDESGATIPAESRTVAVIGFDGIVWENLGSSQGISDGRAVDLNFAFSAEGTPYVAYEDYSGGQKGTVLKYSDKSWAEVGVKNFTPMRVDKFSFTVGENDQPIIAATTFTAIPGYIKRSVYVSNYTLGRWNDITPTIKNPLLGSLSTFRGLDGKTYLAVADRDNTLSMFKLTNGAWQPVGPTGFRGPDNLPPYTSVIGAASADGHVYIGYQTVVSGARLNRILMFNSETSTWQELGSAGSSQGVDELYALAIDPSGQLYFAFADESGLNVRTFNTNTNNWNTERRVVSGKINAFAMQVSSDGIPYLAVSTASDNKTAVYKYTTTK